MTPIQPFSIKLFLLSNPSSVTYFSSSGIERAPYIPGGKRDHTVPHTDSSRCRLTKYIMKAAISIYLTPILRVKYRCP